MSTTLPRRTSSRLRSSTSLPPNSVGEQEMNSVGDGGTVLELVEVEATQAAELVCFLPRQGDGDHDLAVALALTVAALTGGVGWWALEHVRPPRTPPSSPARPRPPMLHAPPRPLMLHALKQSLTSCFRQMAEPDPVAVRQVAGEPRAPHAGPIVRHLEDAVGVQHLRFVLDDIAGLRIDALSFLDTIGEECLRLR